MSDNSLRAFIPAKYIRNDDDVCIPDGALLITRDCSMNLELNEFNTVTEISETLTGQTCYFELVGIEVNEMPGFVYLLRCKYLDENTPSLEEAKCDTYPGTTNLFLFSDMRTAWNAMKREEANVFDLFEM